MARVTTEQSYNLKLSIDEAELVLAVLNAVEADDAAEPSHWDVDEANSLLAHVADTLSREGIVFDATLAFVVR